MLAQRHFILAGSDESRMSRPLGSRQHLIADGQPRCLRTVTAPFDDTARMRNADLVKGLLRGTFGHPTPETCPHPACAPKRSGGPQRLRSRSSPRSAALAIFADDPQTCRCARRGALRTSTTRNATVSVSQSLARPVARHGRRGNNSPPRFQASTACAPTLSPWLLTGTDMARRVGNG
jgi:hypothetical protein